MAPAGDVGVRFRIRGEFSPPDGGEEEGVAKGPNTAPVSTAGGGFDGVLDTWFREANVGIWESSEMSLVLELRVMGGGRGGGRPSILFDM